MAKRKRTAKPKQTPAWLDPATWDFRAVTARELPFAAAYEYARSCTAVLGLWAKWQTSTVVVPEGRILVKQALDGYPAGLPEAFASDPVAAALMASFPRPLRHAGLDGLLWRAPAFPKPWLSLPPEQRKWVLALADWGFRERAFRSREDIPGAPDAQWAKAAEDPVQRRRLARQKPASLAFEVVVDFSRITRDIEADFGAWLRVQRDRLRAKRVIPASTAPTPKVKPEALRCLGAYRLNGVGHNQESARLMLNAYMKTVADPKKVICYLPLTTDPSTWSDWLRQAREYLGRYYVVAGPLSKTGIPLGPLIRPPGARP